MAAFVAQLRTRIWCLRLHSLAETVGGIGAASTACAQLPAATVASAVAPTIAHVHDVGAGCAGRVLPPVRRLPPDGVDDLSVVAAPHAEAWSGGGAPGRIQTLDPQSMKLRLMPGACEGGGRWADPSASPYETSISRRQWSLGPH